jgi:hypothetical protein
MLPKLGIYSLTGFVALTSLHLLAYVLLRVGGVFYAFYNQGYGDIDGGTGILWLDLSFLPYVLMEGMIHVQLDAWGWMPHPSGG